MKCNSRMERLKTMCYSRMDIHVHNGQLRVTSENKETVLLSVKYKYIYLSNFLFLKLYRENYLSCLKITKQLRWFTPLIRHAASYGYSSSKLPGRKHHEQAIDWNVWLCSVNLLETKLRLLRSWNSGHGEIHNKAASCQQTSQHPSTATAAAAATACLSVSVCCWSKANGGTATFHPGRFYREGICCSASLHPSDAWSSGRTNGARRGRRQRDRERGLAGNCIC